MASASHLEPDTDVSMCVCLCMYIYVSVCMCIWESVRIDICVFAHICAVLHVHRHTRHLYTDVQACTRLHVCVCKYMFIYLFWPTQ